MNTKDDTMITMIETLDGRIFVTSAENEAKLREAIAEAVEDGVEMPEIDDALADASEATTDRRYMLVNHCYQFEVVCGPTRR